ncbi:MAG: hypothetical protein Q8O45_12310 [Desulfurivibrionaceae bacterium]|nr:hypothetical protein [Desulfurivibrionaceae bacterium]
MEDKKRRGRPPKKSGEELEAGPGKHRLVRVNVPPRLDSLLRQMQARYGYCESEIVRRALDEYFRFFIEKNEIKVK